MQPGNLTPYEQGFMDRLSPEMVDRLTMMSKVIRPPESGEQLTQSQLKMRELINDMGKGALAYFPLTSASNLSGVPMSLYDRFGTTMGEDEVTDMLRKVSKLQSPAPRSRLSLNMAPGVSDAYDPVENIVNLNRSNLKRGVVGHEFGHAMRPGMKNMYHYGGKLGKFMMFPSAFVKDEKLREAAGTLGSAAMLPRVYEEIMASRAGSKLLKDQGVKGMRRLSPYVGVPTYAATAALPFLMAKARGWLDKYMDTDKKPR